MTLTQSWFAIVKRTKRRVLQWISTFVQFQVRVDTCTKLIFHYKMHKKTCFAMDSCICIISSKSWHLQKADFPLKNTQKYVFCNGLLRLCNFKSKLTLAQIGFSIVKPSRRCVLQWIIAFVQFKVRVDTCTKLIFHCKMHKKTCFAMNLCFCATSSQSWHLHKADFPF